MPVVEQQIVPGGAGRPRRLALTCVAVVALAVALALRLWLQVVGPLPGERAAFEQFPAWPPRHGVWGELVTFFDLLGRPLFALVAVGVAAFLLWRSLGARSALFVVLASGAVVPNAILKVLLGPTPLWRELHDRPGPLGHNYPSGHVVYAMAFVGALAWLAHRRGRRDLVLLAAVPIVLMGPLRVVGGAHLASDVIAGYLVGAAWLAAVGAVAGMGRRAERG